VALLNTDARTHTLSRERSVGVRGGPVPLSKVQSDGLSHPHPTLPKEAEDRGSSCPWLRNLPLGGTPPIPSAKGISQKMSQPSSEGAGKKWRGEAEVSSSHPSREEVRRTQLPIPVPNPWDLQTKSGRPPSPKSRPLQGPPTTIREEKSPHLPTGGGAGPRIGRSMLRRKGMQPPGMKDPS
jgi:hypothetical protein